MADSAADDAMPFGTGGIIVSWEAVARCGAERFVPTWKCQARLFDGPKFEDVLRPFDQLLPFEGFDNVIFDSHFHDLHDILFA